MLKPEEYEESACLLRMEKKGAPARAIPVGRVMEKLDEYLSRNDTDGALRHLRYWEAEAEDGGDDRGLLTVDNELMGLYRKLGKKEEAFSCARRAGQLTQKLGLTGHLTGATVCLNQATVCEAFGQSGEALEKYRRAREIYEHLLEPDDLRLLGLYNNMGLACTALEKYDEAEDLFRRAIEQTAGQADWPEAAVSCLNMADLMSARLSPEEAEKAAAPWLDKAEEYLFDPSIPEDGNYGFVLEKCAPVFGWYGRFLAEKKAAERSEEIYAGHGTGRTVL